MDYIILGLIVCFCFILFYARAPLTLLLTGCLRYNISTENEEQGNLRFSRFFLFLFILALVSFFIAFHDNLLSPLPLFMLGMSKSMVCLCVLAVFITLFLARTILLKIIGWTIDSPAFTNFLNRTAQDFCVLTGFVFIPFLLLFSILGNPSGNGVIIAAGVVAIAGYVFYIYRCARIFLSAGFSLFFWILYLCTLELVPLGVIIQIVAGI
ncbi:MAG: DUF4271 domain-containing protein [Bacteroidales bacterium]|jgi:hypothetical protein|nr:DUF4271 domain-containing protein [Bacteroidales bacterium]HPJ82673.1 DUF4271 domain-containing protein [Bacteroidales bacterium]